MKITGKRTLKLLQPTRCEWCSCTAGPTDPAWGVLETVVYAYDLHGMACSRSDENKLAEKVTLFEAQAIYSGAMQWPAPVIEVEEPIAKE
jgi:hypothetical protein